MPNDRHYDVIIIGTGAGGGTLARSLAPSGKRILILERGEFIPRERENWDPKAVFEDKRYLTKELWYDKDDQPFSPYTHYCVGGNTKVYGAALLRMREHDFGAVRHYGGLSPAWPLAYEDFEEYYTKAERLYSVHGQRGLDPHDPPASKPYPHQAVSPEPRIKELFDDLTAVGCRPFPVPLGVRLDANDPSAAPYRLSNFDGYPDLTETKSDAHVVGIKPVLGLPNVTMRTGALVERLKASRDRRTVTEVIARHEGRLVSFRGDIVVLACGAVNSAALLLRSADAEHPTGLANSSDQVGRNYMTHHNGILIAVTSQDNPSPFQKHFGITDFYRGADDSPLPLGTIQLMGKPDRGTLEWARGDKLPGVAIEDIQRRTIDFFLTAEDLPSPLNRVTVRPDGTIKITYTPNNLEAYRRLEVKTIQALDAADRLRGRPQATYLGVRLGVSGVSHQNGTLRFGTDPATSVLDLSCKAHDLDNLYVVDSSFFPSSSAVNPSLTIMANALRVGDHLLQRLGAGSTSHHQEILA
ncbi:MAG: GMC family oxidoreductase [Planctomycetota bacterium]